MQKLRGLLLLVVRKYQLVRFVLVSCIFVFLERLVFLFVPGNDTLVRYWLWIMISVFYWMLERLDPDTSGILTTLCDHSFDCPCVSKWTYLSCQVFRFFIPLNLVCTVYHTSYFGWFRWFYCLNVLV